MQREEILLKGAWLDSQCPLRACTQGLILCIIFPFQPVIFLLALVSQVLPYRVVLAWACTQKPAYFFRVTSQLYISRNNKVLEDFLSMEFISNPLISLNYADLVPACGGMVFFFPQGVILPSVPTTTGDLLCSGFGKGTEFLPHSCLYNRGFLVFSYLFLQLMYI